MSDEQHTVHKTIAELRERGCDDTTIGHLLISEGLYHLAGNLCSVGLAEQLGFVHDWIGERLAETQRELN